MGWIDLFLLHMDAMREGRGSAYQCGIYSEDIGQVD
jgi:hypothetical protein